MSEGFQVFKCQLKDSVYYALQFIEENIGSVKAFKYIGGKKKIKERTKKMKRFLDIDFIKGSWNLRSGRGTYFLSFCRIVDGIYLDQILKISAKKLKGGIFWFF